MSVIKAILLGGAAYFALRKIGVSLSGGSSEKQIEDLENRLQEQIAETVKAEQAAEDLRNQYEGDLKDRITCYLTARVSRIGWVGDYWNSKYELTITNKGTTPITISAARVYFSCEGIKSLLVPWTTNSYTIQPGKKVAIDLWCFNNKNMFTELDARKIENLLMSEGKKKDSEECVKRLPLYCEAEFAQSVNGENYPRTMKNFSGVLIGYRNGEVYRPYKWENGTQVTGLNELFSPKEEEDGK